MRKIGKKKLIMITLICLFILISFIAPKSVTIINQVKSRIYLSNLEEDNWEITTTFYDSSVDDGQTPLSEINWDGGTGNNRVEKTITLQINYKNTNSMKDYEPGELEIEIPNILYHTNDGNFLINSGWSDRANSVMNIGANDSQHTGYDWNYYSGTVSVSPTIEKIKLYNAVKFEKNVNYEGTIQIKYYLASEAEQSKYYGLPHVESYENSCEHYFKDNYQAILSTVDAKKNKISSIYGNDLYFTFSRTYIHEWERMNYTITKAVKKLNAIDKLPNVDNYIWVEYDFSINDQKKWVYTYAYYPYITASSLEIRDSFPEGSIVLDTQYNELKPSSDNQYVFSINGYSSSQDPPRYKKSIYVGYPVDDFNEENDNMNITNTAQLYVKYVDRTEFEYQDEGTVSFDLNKYKFGDLVQKYTIDKSCSGTSGTIDGITECYNSDDSHNNVVDASKPKSGVTYEGINGTDSNLGNSFTSHFTISSNYIGEKYDLKLGDDLLYIEQQDGSYMKLDEENYYFTSVGFPYYFLDGNGNTAPQGSYNIDLYVKSVGEEDYRLYKTVTNNRKYGDRSYIYFSEDEHITAFYFYIRDLDISFCNTNMYWQYESFYATVKIVNVKKLKENSGKIINMAYLDSYINGERVDIADESSYKYIMADLKVYDYDMENYGHYKLRDATAYNYYNYDIESPRHYLYMSGSTGSLKQNELENNFSGTSTVSMKLVSSDYGRNKYTQNEIDNYLKDIPKEEWSEGYEFYDLLPEGMELNSTSDEIINSMYDSKYYLRFLFYDGTEINGKEVLPYLKEHCRVEIENNWNNSNRTRIHIVFDLSDNPVIVQLNDSYIDGNFQTITGYFSFKFNYTISYEAYLEFGSSFKNEYYYKFYNRTGDDIEYMGDTGFNVSGHIYCDKDENGNYIERDLEFISKIYNGDISDWENSTSSYSSYYYSRRVGTNYYTISLDYIISTNQDFSVFTQTANNNYSFNKVNVDYDSEYKYKLRIRSGSSKITNIEIYDNLEKYAKVNQNVTYELAAGDDDYWQGTFNGIDTSFAKSQGYYVKVYYSENDKPDTLKNDDSWKEYVEGVTDKSVVKSLAFEYLDADGNKAVMPENDFSYVIIKMKSPSNSLSLFTYNGAWTKWSAIDDSGETVDKVEGVNSNVVKLALSTTLTIKHLNYQTNEEMSETLVRKVYGGDEYETSSASDIPTNYYLKEVPSNASGIVDVFNPVVTYYYAKRTPVVSSSLSTTGTELINTNSEKVEYTIDYSPKIKDFIGNANVEITSYLDYKIDVDKSNLDGGIYDSENNTITWKKSISIDSIDEIINNYKFNLILFYKDIPFDNNLITFKTNSKIIAEDQSDIQESIINTELKQEAKLIVKYLEYGTNKVLSDEINEVVYGGDEYETESSNSVPKDYDLKYVPTNYKGIISNKDVEVIWYYERREPNLSSSLILTGTDEITNKDDKVNYKITYSTSVADYIGDTKVLITDILPYEIDVNKSNLDGGIYNKGDNTITWIDNFDINDIDGDTYNYEFNISVVYKNMDLKNRIINNMVTGSTTIDNGAIDKSSSFITNNHIKGKIIVKYIDIETNEELVENIVTSNYIGEEFVPEFISFDKYYLIESPNENSYSYDEEDTIIYYKYQRKKFKIITLVENQSGGTIEGDEEIYEGDNSTDGKIVIKAEHGYCIDVVTINGEKIDIDSNQEVLVLGAIKNIDEDYVIVVSFAKKNIVNPNTKSLNILMVIVFLTFIFSLLSFSLLNNKKMIKNYLK